MKKLLVLALVLSMATMASAALVTGLQISINGDKQAAPITLTPSQTASLDIWTDSGIQTNTGFNLLLVATTGGSIDYLSGVVAYNDPQVKFERSGNAHVYLGDSSGLLPANEEGLGAYAFAQNGVIPSGSTLFDAIVFHCDGRGDVTLKLYTVNDDYDQLTLVDSAVIHQVPEPITMALLGLGGLFLRRRSK
jgi:hypothetical protein